ncbi:MAG: hypothetical protein ACFFKA_07015 [Candidatus Thorarchaeota archaeon]
MPVHSVRKNGKIVGYQWGNHGKIYRGKDARKKAGKQGAAAHASGYKGSNNKPNGRPTHKRGNTKMVVKKGKSC